MNDSKPKMVVGVWDNQPTRAYGSAAYLSSVGISASANGTLAGCLDWLQSAASDTLPKVVVVQDGSHPEVVVQVVSKLRERGTQIVVGLDQTNLFLIDELRNHGVNGVVLLTASLETLKLSIEAVMAGTTVFPPTQHRSRRKSLTPREQEIVRLVARGMKNKQIADALYITTGTVKVHLMHIFEKIGVRDRFELAARVSGRELE